MGAQFNGRTWLPILFVYWRERKRNYRPGQMSYDRVKRVLSLCSTLGLVYSCTLDHQHLSGTFDHQHLSANFNIDLLRTPQAVR